MEQVRKTDVLSSIQRDMSLDHASCCRRAALKLDTSEYLRAFSLWFVTDEGKPTLRYLRLGGGRKRRDVPVTFLNTFHSEFLIAFRAEMKRHYFLFNADVL